MKVLFLCPYPQGQSPSQRFRFEQYFEILKTRGAKVQLQSFWSPGAWEILYKRGRLLEKLSGFLSGIFRRVIILFTIYQFDYVFIHRESLPIGPPLLEWIISKILRKKIIYDFDDAIWIPNTSVENKFAAFLKWHQKTGSICKWSYKVSCGNTFLANYARNFNPHVIVNPTTIDTEFLHNPARQASPENQSVVVGWTGTQSTLPYLSSILPVLDILWEKYPGRFRFLIIANRNPDFKKSYVDFKAWSIETEIADLLTLDIGLMPLNDDDWARGKCGFKALQYMALEKPTVASAVGLNLEIVDDGKNGFLCKSDQQWLEALEKLLLDSDLRKAMGKAGRKKVISNYSVSSNSVTVLSLFS